MHYVPFYDSVTMPQPLEKHIEIISLCPLQVQCPYDEFENSPWLDNKSLCPSPRFGPLSSSFLDSSEYPILNDLDECTTCAVSHGKSDMLSSSAVPPIGRIVAVGIKGGEGHAIVNWVTENILRKTDVLVLVMLWEKLEIKANDVRSPGVILLSSDDVLEYNLSSLRRHRNYAKSLIQSINGNDVLAFFIPFVKRSKNSIGKLICGAAKELRANLLILGNGRCKGNFQHFLSGSISKHVANNAVCPVVLVQH
ncbi:universal stress family protein [Cardiosporidium cionae]|uniref:Universal stress family protein n=1 Tax=Cardiosporidium cionae TaxID=476202 RepID=A0ABQ7J7C6_9APIC|nr:universal stress family protein [Cardiosporidium cionae]|eukprot:KAF8819887.1 universal stress family protein [Cardiosporidium cionae]